MPVYHVSPSSNDVSIKASGLLKGMARGKRKAVYVCSLEKVPWAIAHVCKRHQCSFWGITIHVIRNDDVWGSDGRKRLIRIKDGLYYTPFDVKPNEICRTYRMEGTVNL